MGRHPDRTRFLFGSFVLLVVGVLLWLGRTQSTWWDVTTARKATQVAIFRLPITWAVEETRASQLLADCTRGRDEEPHWKLISETSFWQPVSPHFRPHASADLFDEAVILLEESATGADVCSTLLELRALLRENRWDEARHLLQPLNQPVEAEAISSVPRSLGSTTRLVPSTRSRPSDGSSGH